MEVKCGSGVKAAYDFWKSMFSVNEGMSFLKKIVDFLEITSFRSRCFFSEEISFSEEMCGFSAHFYFKKQILLSGENRGFSAVMTIGSQCF